MIEPLVFQANQKAEGYIVDGDLEKILPLVRQAVELGAAVIKEAPTADLSVCHKVVQNPRNKTVLETGRSKDAGQNAPDRQ